MILCYGNPREKISVPNVFGLHSSSWHPWDFLNNESRTVFCYVDEMTFERSLGNQKWRLVARATDFVITGLELLAPLPGPGEWRGAGN